MKTCAVSKCMYMQYMYAEFKGVGRIFVRGFSPGLWMHLCMCNCACHALSARTHAAEHAASEYVSVCVRMYTLYVVPACALLFNSHCYAQTYINCGIGPKILAQRANCLFFLRVSSIFSLVALECKFGGKCGAIVFLYKYPDLSGLSALFSSSQVG